MERGLDLSLQRVHVQSALNSHASYPYGHLVNAEARKRYSYVGKEGATVAHNWAIEVFKEIDLKLVGCSIIDVVTPPTDIPRDAQEKVSMIWGAKKNSAPLVLVGTKKDGTKVGPSFFAFKGRMGESRYNKFKPIIPVAGVTPDDAKNMDELRSTLQKFIKVLFFAEHHILPPKVRGLIESDGCESGATRAQLNTFNAWTGNTCRNPPDGKIDVCGKA
jgi:hypothetical protein